MSAESRAVSLGTLKEPVAEALNEADESAWSQRVWRRDATVWKEDEANQKIIGNSLGWLTVVGKMIGVADQIVTFADEIRLSREFDHVMLCGMGGSSLCPEVFRETFRAQEGYPELLVLDSTDPDVLASFADQIDVARCLFVVASKSGTTTEPLVFYKYWYDQVRQRKANPGASFLAITDPGTRMVEMATADQFRHIFLNPSDIGGRYSALSYFGMVPAALMGVDIKRLLVRAEAMAEACGAGVSAKQNPGMLLGAIMGECAKVGRDKLTIITDEKVSALGLWIEQLVAESTGKEGKGILPVNAESLGKPSDYGDDRLFVSVSVGPVVGDNRDKLEALAKAGHPVVYRPLNDLYDLGSEFFLWEIATAFAGWRLGINPFDQPNVQESKDATKELLDSFKAHGKLKEQEALVSDGMLTVYASDRTRETLPASSVGEVVRAHLAGAKAGDYVALLDYIEETPEIEATLQSIRIRIRNATKCATTTGYGPRFLHSTGQLHKGGPDTGVFIQITAADKVDLPIPNEPYTFSVLKQAQALGDFRSLSAHGRRAIRVDLGTDVVRGLKELMGLVSSFKTI